MKKYKYILTLLASLFIYGELFAIENDSKELVSLEEIEFLEQMLFSTAIDEPSNKKEKVSIKKAKNKKKPKIKKAKKSKIVKVQKAKKAKNKIQLQPTNEIEQKEQNVKQVIVVKGIEKEVKKLDIEDDKLKKIFSYENFATNKLLKLYKENIINTSKFSKSKQEKLINEIKKRFSNLDQNVYDHIALQNAIEHIEKGHVSKYETLEIVNTMIMEIK